MYAMLLNDSDFKGEADWFEVQRLARGAKGEDEFGYRAEFIQLAERAELAQKQKVSRE